MENKLYTLDSNYTTKLDLIVKRLNGNDDAMLVIDGDEGTGKTEFAFGTCHYVAERTNRKYDIDNIYFDLNKLMKDASTTEGKIFHYDEAVLGLMSTKWQEQAQQQFLQLAMVARKKRHLIILCIPKFYKLNSYIIQERVIGLVHTYARKNIEKGRFCYYTKSKKEKLYNTWKRQKVKAYKEHRSFWGTFPIVSDKIFTKEQIEEYERKKDEGILSIFEDKKSEEGRIKNIQWMHQRDNLIRFVKDELQLTFAELHRRLKGYGTKDISVETLKRGYKGSRDSASL